MADTVISVVTVGIVPVVVGWVLFDGAASGAPLAAPAAVA